MQPETPALGLRIDEEDVILLVSTQLVGKGVYCGADISACGNAG